MIIKIKRKYLKFKNKKMNKFSKLVNLINAEYVYYTIKLFNKIANMIIYYKIIKNGDIFFL